MPGHNFKRRLPISGGKNVTHAFMYGFSSNAFQNTYPEENFEEHQAWALGRAFRNDYLDCPEKVTAYEKDFEIIFPDNEFAIRIPFGELGYQELAKQLHKQGIAKTYGTYARKEQERRAIPETGETRPPVPPDNRIWTLSGQSFDFFSAPREFEKYKRRFNINDIAVGLSHICRWGGQVKQFYSVAQHCCLTSMLCGPDNKYYGLMHDTPEAYLDDMQRPLKQNFPEYRNVEDLLEPVLLETFGLTGGKPPEVKFVDSCLAVAEARALGLGKVFRDPMYKDMVRAADEFFASKNMDCNDLIMPWSMDRSRKIFLKMFKELKPEWLKIDARGFARNAPAIEEAAQPGGMKP